MTWHDLTLFAVLAVLFPIAGRGAYQRFRKQIADGAADARRENYRYTMLLEWVLLATVVLLWWHTGRPFDALGLVEPAGWRFWIGMAAALAAAAVFAWHAWKFPRSTPEDQEKVRVAFEPLRDFLPQDRRELRSFWFLSLAAGICEEVVYRGYLFWLLGGLGGTWLAVLGSSAVFALGHTYQGATGVARVFLIGLFMGALYLLSGSLWAPILLHILGDVFQGLLAYRVANDDPALPATLESPPQAVA